jgi:preprotein translocase subunit SecE
MKTIEYPNRREAANTLIVTIITMAIMCVFIDLAMQYTNSIGRNVRRSLLLRQATNIR